MRNLVNVKFLSLLPLFMVILIDVMGIILVMPVITPLILEHGNGLLAETASQGLRNFMYGFALALFPFFMFFSTPILGDLSDRFGRKKILFLCLIVNAIGCALSAVAIWVHSLSLFIVSRAVAGLAAGTQPIATAGILDESEPASRTRYLSWVVLAVSAGLILGPLLGGITAEKSFVSWFGYDTPFIAAAILSFLNAILLYMFYREKFITPVQHKIELLRGFKLFLAAFTESKFRLLSILVMCFILAWSLYYQAVNWVLNQQFHYNVGHLGFFIGFMGIVFALTTFLMRILANIFPNETTLFAGSIFIMMIGNAGAALSHSEFGQWFWVIFTAGSDVVCYTLAMSIFSSLAGKEAQGWVMGVTSAIAAMTWTIGGLIVGPLGTLNLYAPFWTAAGLSFVSFILILIYRK
ncbi:MAG: MFS transporter [Gammaproteobacteria bacterium]|nr:MFS transporter [Gammaproteobacteria bacterium]